MGIEIRRSRTTFTALSLILLCFTISYIGNSRLCPSNKQANRYNQSVQNRETSSLSKIDSLYTLIYKRQMALLESGSKPKLVVYRFKDGSGFGNRMRATSFAFLLSLLTERLFLVEHEDHELHFANPGSSMNIFWKNFDCLLTFKNLSRQIISVPQAHYKDFCAILPLLDASADMYEQIHGNDPSYCFLKNESYKKRAVKIFGTSDESRIKGQIMSFLLKNPQPNLLLYVSKLKQEMQWEVNQLHVCIQFRAFIDVGLKNMNFFHEFCDRSKELLLKIFAMATQPSRAIWVTSDFEDVPQLFKSCSGLKNVSYMVSPFKTEHTSRMNNGIIKSPIAEWYLMGEADWVLSTGTSFAKYALARVNFSNHFYLWKAGAHRFEPYLEPA